MKKTKEEIKNEIAQSHDYDSWDQMLLIGHEGNVDDDLIELMEDEAMQSYADQETEELYTQIYEADEIINNTELRVISLLDELEVLKADQNKFAGEMVEKFVRKQWEEKNMEVPSTYWATLEKWLSENGLAEQHQDKCNVIINGIGKTLTSEIITYEQLCELAGFDIKHNPTITYSIRHSNQGGILHHGQSVTIIEGMIFNITITGNA